MRTAHGVGLLVVLSMAPLIAKAQPETTAEIEARARFQAGEAAYARGDFDTPLGDFEQAYRVSPGPTLLFNIGIAAQRARQRERALEALRAYLQAVPDAPNRGDVEARITEVEELLSVQRERDAAVAAANRENGSEPSSSGPGALPWIVIGGSAAVAIGGAVLFGIAQGDIATVEGIEDGTMWSEVMDAHDRAPVFSGIGLAMIGVGLAGAGVGIVLLVGGGAESGATATVSLGPGHLTLRSNF